ncbi:hypothetical protein HYX10_01130 [Candidatus Woesearchaeota archaeon]|nr:hypothetical protein [Candidatus Woesearchaeota archaeon]
MSEGLEYKNESAVYSSINGLAEQLVSAGDRRIEDIIRHEFNRLVMQAGKEYMGRVAAVRDKAIELAPGFVESYSAGLKSVSLTARMMPYAIPSAAVSALWTGFVAVSTSADVPDGWHVAGSFMFAALSTYALRNGYGIIFQLIMRDAIREKKKFERALRAAYTATSSARQSSG